MTYMSDCRLLLNDKLCDWQELHRKIHLKRCSGGLTGDAEAKNAVVLLHELLQQRALPCPGWAAQHHRPWSSHSCRRGGEKSLV